MKISRFKKSHKIIQFFATHFNYHEPYQVLIDATFCQAALQNKVVVDEQIKKLFQCAVRMVTTQCIILEAESLGPALVGATQIVKKFFVHKCGHEGNPISAAECIKFILKEGRYVVATQDRDLQEKLRKVPGRCILYLHRTTPVLEEPSKASKQWVLKKQTKDLLPEVIEKRIERMKLKEGLKPTTNDDKPRKKHKGPKMPNPLSCKRSKNEKHLAGQKKSKKSTPLSEASKTEMKPKRKRIKTPKHIKEALKNNNSSSIKV